MSEQEKIPIRNFPRSEIFTFAPYRVTIFRLPRLSIYSHISSLFWILFPFFAKKENESIENIHKYRKIER